jgi:hypothetical protein
MAEQRWTLELIIVTTLAAFSASTPAAENTGQRTIVDMGCDNVDSVCYIDISGAPAGASTGCSSNLIQWDSLNDPNGKNTYAALMAAFISGKQVNVYINSCFAARPAYPTIWYFNIYN